MLSRRQLDRNTPMEWRIFDLVDGITKQYAFAITNTPNHSLRSPSTIALAILREQGKDTNEPLQSYHGSSKTS